MKNYYSILLLVFVFFITETTAQELYKLGARSAALGHTSVTINDIWAYHHNPGMLGYLEQGGVGVYYENRFFLRELNYQGLTFAQPLKKGTISAGAQFSGFENYRSARAGAGYSLRLTDYIAMGVQVNYLNVSIPGGYGTKHGISGEFGLATRIGKKWMIGASIYNITRTRFASYQNERFASVIRLGASYLISQKLTASAEFEKSIISPLQIKGALEYQPIEKLFLRAGVHSSPLEISFGLGYNLKGLRIDLASSYKQIIGFTTGVSIHYCWGT
ncbi:hypothetical protein GCM10009118_31790 [Wandonia haliotis]|uniref:Uncharacterized protein n=1 Tax=Wandonia haliotis TaxID=574963 RepID=A0ABP3Y5G4_9FLAO